MRFPNYALNSNSAEHQSPAGSCVPAPLIGLSPQETELTILPAANVVDSWLSDRGTTVATGVSAWVGAASATSLAQVTAGAQPAFSRADSRLNGRPSITGDGTNDELVAALAIPAPGTTARYYRFVGAQLTYAAAALMGGSAASCQLVYQNGGTPNLRAFNLANSSLNANAPVGAPRVFEVYFSNSVADFLRIGSVTVTGSSTGNASAATWSIFSGGGAAFSNMMLGNVTIAALPTTQQRAAIDRLDRRRYGFGVLQ
jgi:hypothetical protein